MKKLLIASVVAGSLISTSAFAKTQGNYIGIDALRSSGAFYELETNGISSGNNAYKIEDSNQISYGLNYKYAFNFNQVFVAPGLFFDDTSLSMKDSDQDTWDVNSRYGIKVDLGYDVNDKLAVFANVAIAKNNYKVDWKSVSRSSKGSDISPSFGLGVKYSITNHVDLNLAYESTILEMNTPHTTNTQTATFDLDIIRVGASYKF